MDKIAKPASQLALSGALDFIHAFPIPVSEFVLNSGTCCDIFSGSFSYNFPSSCRKEEYCFPKSCSISTQKGAPGKFKFGFQHTPYLDKVGLPYQENSEKSYFGTYSNDSA